MLIKLNLPRLVFRFCLFASALLLIAFPARSQTPANDQIAKTIVTNKTAAATSPQPSLRDYKGVTIGMSSDEARNKLDHLRDKGKDQDYYVFSDTESAQVFYDKAGNVTCVSIDFRGRGSNPPTPMEVLGNNLQPKADGSMYELKRYPKAGYWVAYNRTAGNDPTVTITMQKMW